MTYEQIVEFITSRMKMSFRYFLFLGLLIPAILFTARIPSTYAETYKWRDDKGAMHFTDNPYSIPEKYREKVYAETRSEMQSRSPQLTTQANPQKYSQVPQHPTVVIPQVNSATPYQNNIDHQKHVQESMRLQRAKAVEQSKKTLQEATHSVVKFMLFLIIGGSLVQVIKRNKSKPRRPWLRSRSRSGNSYHASPATNNSNLKVIAKKPAIEHEIVVSADCYQQSANKAECDILTKETNFPESSPIHTVNPYLSIHNQTPKSQQWDDTILKIIEWRRFEIVCVEFFKMKGYQAEETRVGSDGGVDINLYIDALDAPAAVVQCKAWNTYKVGVKPIRELYGVMAGDHIEEGFFVTSGEFTQEAYDFAQGKKLHLMTGERLLDEIKKLPLDKQDQLLKVALDGDYSTPTCPQCDIKLIIRESKSGRNAGEQFWGCVNYPKCKQTFKFKDSD